MSLCISKQYIVRDTVFTYRILIDVMNVVNKLHVEVIFGWILAKPIGFGQNALQLGFCGIFC